MGASSHPLIPSILIHPPTHPWVVRQEAVARPQEAVAGADEREEEGDGLARLELHGAQDGAQRGGVDAYVCSFISWRGVCHKE